MKNINTRDLERKAEIAEEFNTVLQIAELFAHSGVKLTRSVEHYSNELDDYMTGFDSRYMTKTNQAKLDDIRDILSPLSEGSAESIVQAINAQLSQVQYTHIDLLNYNKLGLKEGVGQKSDISITAYNQNDIVFTKHVSLKQYKSFSDIQVASGTYLSTICGLGFEPVGRGKFIKPDGNTFTSKNYEQVIQSFVSFYGSETEEPLTEIMKITRRVHSTFRTMPTKPSKAVWKRACVTTGKEALVPLVELLNIIQKSDPAGFKDRFVSRSGLKNSSDKEIVYSAWKAKTATQPKRVVTFNTMSDIDFSDMVSSINKPSTVLEVSIHGQSARISFMDNNKQVLVADTPLTINSNGAWANKNRYSKIDKMEVLKNQLRPIKAMQLDTSTNCWLKIKAACLNGILKQRRIK
jgi:hypothetical protein